MECIFDYSQYGQVEVLERLLPPDTPQSVVDIGAYDGVTGSNSRKFLQRGWRAIMVEPVPEVFRQLKANCRGFPSAKCVNVACSDRPSRGRLLLGPDGSFDQTGSLRAGGGSGEFVDVDVLTATTVLEREGWPTRFGVLLVDTEGLDLEVLQGLDPARFQPVAVVTEEDRSVFRRHRQKYDLLFRRGYSFCGVVGSDSIWVLRGRAMPLPASGAAPLAWRPDRTVEGRSAGYLDQPVSWTRGKTPATLLRPAAGVQSLAGWAIDGKRGTVPPQVAFRVTNERTGSVEFYQAFRTPRPDVVRVTGNEALFYSGFRGAIPLAGRAPDTHSVAILQVAGSRVLESGTALRLEIRPQICGRTVEESAANCLNGAGLRIGSGGPALPHYCRAVAVDGTEDADIDPADLENVAGSTQEFVLGAGAMEASWLAHARRVLKPAGTLFLCGSAAAQVLPDVAFDTVASDADRRILILRKRD